MIALVHGRQDRQRGVGRAVEVVGEADAVARGDGQHLVRKVRKEGDPGRLPVPAG